MAHTQFCPKCKKTMDEANFYTYKNGEKVELCKKCQTMHIDNANPETFLWLLEQMDVPYIKEEWDTLYNRALAKDPYKITGMSVFGKYLSKMKLRQWMDYGWADTERLKAEKDMKMNKAQEQGLVKSPEVLKEMLESGEINEAEYLTLSEEKIAAGPPPSEYYPSNNPGYEMVDIAVDLTEEDKVYLAMKWGRLYRPDQWVSLEKMYSEMMHSFDIQGAAREDTMKKICKTSLKMDEAIDCGDVDTYQKLSRVYDALMKSGKFTEAQNKEDGKGFVNSVGELVAICEKEEGFIPRFDIEVNPDIVDKTIQDMNNYVYKLVTKDMGLGQQIEDALKKIEIQKEMEEEELFDINDAEAEVLNDIDFEEFFEEVENQKSIDDGIAEFLGQEEE